MKNINEFILEKFKINSENVHSPEKNLAKLFNLDQDEAKYLYQFWDNENKLIKFTNPVCSPLEGLLMLAFMLVDDNMDFDTWDFLGTKSYKKLGGKNNPYDYSWFEEEDEKDQNLDYLCAIGEWIKENTDEFKKIYEIVKKHKKDFSFDKIWEDIQDIM